MAKKLRGVFYIRMSSSPQENSPGRQRTQMQELLVPYGAELKREYFDKARSGSDTAKRTEFLRMIADAEKGEFDIIFVDDQNRFSRADPLETASYFHRLRTAGVRIVSVADGDLKIESDNIGDLIVGMVRSHKNHDENVTRSRQVLTGIHSRLEKGELHFAATPYGYEKLITSPDGRLQQQVPRYDEHGNKVRQLTPDGWKCELVVPENSDEVEAVRFIFDAYANRGLSMQKIVAELTRLGYPSPWRTTWHHMKVHRLLSSPVYCGDYSYGKISRALFYQYSKNGGIESDTCRTVGYKRTGNWGKRVLRKNEDDQVYLVRDALPPIVDRETWNRANRRLTGNTKQKQFHGEFALSGILVCGHCGGPMYGRSNYRARGDRCGGSYVCGTFCKNSKECEQYMMAESKILPYVVSLLQEAVTAGGRMDELKAILREKLAKRRTNRPSDSARLQRKLDALAKQIDTAVDRMVRCDDEELASMMSDKIRRIREERKALEDELNESLSTPDAENADPDAVAEMLWSLGEKLASADAGVVRSCVMRLVDRIELFYSSETINGRRKRKFVKGVVFLKQGDIAFDVLARTTGRTCRNIKTTFGADDLKQAAVSAGC